MESVAKNERATRFPWRQLCRMAASQGAQAHKILRTTQCHLDLRLPARPTALHSKRTAKRQSGATSHHEVDGKAEPIRIVLTIGATPERLVQMSHEKVVSRRLRKNVAPGRSLHQVLL